MKNILIALVSITFLISCNKEIAPNTLLLSGTVKGLKKGKLYVQRVQDSTLVVLDTIIINGKSEFESTIQLDEPEMLYLFLDRGVSNAVDNNLLFFAEPGKMTISTEMDLFLSKAKITGSKNQELYEQYKDIVSKYNDQQLELMKQDILVLKNKAVASSETKLKQDAITKRQYMYAANFAVTNGKYEVAPYIVLTDIYDINMKYIDTIQKSMSLKVAKSKYGKKLNDYILERKKTE